MATISKAYCDINKTTGFQSRCDILSKILTVALMFSLPISTALTNVILSFLILAWFLAGNLHHKAIYIFSHPITKLVLVFYLVFVMGSLYSDALGPDISQQLWKMSKLLYILFLLPLSSEKQWRYLSFTAFFMAMVLTLILGLLKIYTGLPIPSKFTAACVFKNHIDTNLMMAFACFILGHFLLSTHQRKLRYMACLLLALMGFYVLWLCEGRSGQIVFAALWLLLCLQRFSFKYILLGVLALAILFGGVWLGSPRFQTRLQSVGEDWVLYQSGKTDTSVGLRLEFIKESWNISQKSPWWGFGTGSFKQVYEQHAEKQGLQITRNPHNEYMNILVQLGILGLSIFLLFLLTLFKISFYLPLTERYLLQGLLASFTIGCLGNSWLMDFTSGYFFVTSIALCLAAYNVDYLKISEEKYEKLYAN